MTSNAILLSLACEHAHLCEYGETFCDGADNAWEKVSLFPARSPLRRQNFSRNRTSEIALKVYFYSWLFSQALFLPKRFRKPSFTCQCISQLESLPGQPGHSGELSLSKPGFSRHLEGLRPQWRRVRGVTKCLWCPDSWAVILITAHIRHRKSRLHYRMVFVKDNLGIHSARLLRAAHNKYANFQRVEWKIQHLQDNTVSRKSKWFDNFNNHVFSIVLIEIATVCT